MRKEYKFLAFSVLGVVACQSAYKPHAMSNSGSGGSSIQPTISISQKCDAQYYDCERVDYLIAEVEIANPYERAICLPLDGLPIDERPNNDLLEIKQQSGEIIYTLDPDLHYVNQDAAAELNYVIAPGNVASGRIVLFGNYEFRNGMTYYLTYRNVASFCDLYDRGNRSKLTKSDPEFVRSNSVSIESSSIKFTIK